MVSRRSRQAGDGGAKNRCDQVMCVGALLSALLPREFFSARGAACDSARCRVRCCCCARRVFLCAGLLRVMIQRVASGGAAVAREFFCCARGCLFCSALPRAVPLLCARVLFAIECRVKGRSKARKQDPGVGFLFRCTKSENFRLALVFMHYATCIQIYCTSSIPDGGTLKPSWRFCGDRRVRGGVGISRPPRRAFD